MSSSSLDIIKKTLTSKCVSRPLWKVQSKWEELSPGVVMVSNDSPKVKLVGLANGDCELNIADYLQYAWLREIVEYPLLNKKLHLIGMNVLDAARMTDKFVSWRRVFDVEVVLSERITGYANMARKEKVQDFLARRLEKILNEFILSSPECVAFKICRRGNNLYLGYDVDPKSMESNNKAWLKTLSMVKEAGLRMLSSYVDLALDVEKYRAGEIRE